MDYYCFPTETGDISVFSNLDQYDEHSNERLFYELAYEDVLQAKEKGKLLLFDLKNKKFIDDNKNIVDITGKEIFPRCKLGDSKKLLKAIEENGGNSIVTRADTKIVENWFEYIDVQRKFLRTTYGEVTSNLDFYEEKYGNELFLKTIKKQFSKVCRIVSFCETKGLFAKVGRSMFGGNMLIYDNSTPVIVTDALTIVEDDYGRREWRTFVVKGKILCISRISDKVVEIEPYVTQKIEQRVEQISKLSTFPSSYCVDFFEYKNNDETIFDICEFNPIESSGKYQNNKLVF